MSRIIIVGTLSIAFVTGTVTPSLAQNPGTVFPGSPPSSGMSAPVAFPANPDPGRLSPLPLDAAADPARLAVDWERQRDMREAGLISAAGPGTNQPLKRLLLGMLAEDVQASGSVPPAAGEPPPDPTSMQSIADKNTAALRAIVAANGWPTIALVGAAASRGAVIVLAHSGDRAWQQALAPQLEQRVAGGQILGPEVAALVDRLLVESGKPQKFGTRFEVRDGEVIIFPVEDPQHLDERRAQFLLVPIRSWRSTLEAIYHAAVKGPV